jgi:hypothetical protein
MLKQKSWFRQFAIPVTKDADPLLPVFVQRDENRPPKMQKSQPLTNFEL